MRHGNCQSFLRMTIFPCLTMCNIKPQLFDEPPSAPHRKACIEEQSRGLCLGMIIEGWRSLIEIAGHPVFLVSR